MSRSLAPCDGAVSANELHEAFREGEVPVGVYGLDAHGVALTGALAVATENVVAADVDADRIDRLSRGEWTATGNEGLAKLLRRAVATDAVSATTDCAEAARRCRVHVVPAVTRTGAGGELDLSTLRVALRDVAAGIDADDLVVVTGVVPPGTCEAFVRPVLADWASLDVTDVGIAYVPSPRRSTVRALRQTASIVAGLDGLSSRAVGQLWDAVTAADVRSTTEVRLVEWSRLVEAGYDAIRQAYANQLARVADAYEIDVTRAIRVANARDCDVPRPSPGIGGVDALSVLRTYAGASPVRLFDAASRVNAGMPEVVADRVRESLGGVGGGLENARVLLLGISHVRDAAESRDAPAFAVADELDRYGAEVFAVDPFVDDARGPFSLVDLAEGVAVDPDAVVLLTPHRAFESVDWDAFDDAVIVDCHGGLDANDLPNRVVGIGDTRLGV